ncbi:MAG: hypothetical protein AAGA56_10260, partial [Myxococcota bacterium]
MSQDAFGKTRLLLSLMMGVACVGFTAVISFEGGDDVARAIFEVALVVLIGGCGAMLVWLRDRSRLTPVAMGAIVALYMLGMTGMLLFWGLYSPAGAIVTVALYISANSMTYRGALAFYFSTVTIHWALWGALMTGLFADPGIINSRDLATSDRVLSFILPQVVYLATLLLGRASRLRTIRSMDELESAVRTNAVRDALLNEAMRELEVAQGGNGLFTGQRV